MFIEDPVEWGVKQAFRKSFNGVLFPPGGIFPAPVYNPVEIQYNKERRFSGKIKSKW